MEHHHQSRPLGGPQLQAATPTADQPEDKPTEGNWSDHEKRVLREAIEHFQGYPIRTLKEVQGLTEEEKKLPFKWSIVALYCQAHGCRRNAKQCRERYINHMAPLRRDKIMPEEGRQIMRLVAIQGKKWAFIGRELNRSENTLKNYWNQERKKGENGRRRNASHSHASRPSQTARQRSLPAHSSHPQSSREHPHSRRESMSSNPPGLVSDHGSPVESSPRSSRHNSFAPVQLPLPPFQGWKPAPASPLQAGYPMDRNQSLSASSASSARSVYVSFRRSDASSPTREYFHQPGPPMFSHHSEARLGGFLERRGQQQQQQQQQQKQQQSSVESRHERVYHQGFEHPPSYAYGQTQVREPHHNSSYCYNPPQHSQAPQLSPMSLPYRAQRETLPPVSSLMNLTASIHQGSQRPSVGASQGTARASSGNMDLRRILN